jgi:RNA polymerase sigma factor (sigma-70 family)
VEASALQAPAGLARGRTSGGVSLLRLRSDDQLVALFRAGHDDAFRVIHDRYRTRLFAYTRQMLPGSRQDAEDALQDVFVKAYSGLRANDRELALRAWLYRVAHNRCIDQLRRPVPMATDALENRAAARGELSDPIAAAEQRETLRRLIADVRRLPEQQRSALLMRELSGMSYIELAEALGLSVPAVKSLLVRARVSLAAAYEARETACEEIRIELSQCHDRGVRPTATARRHMHDCAGCREFRTSVRGLSRNFAALTPAIGPIGIIAKVLGIGIGGGAAAGGSGAAGTGSAAGGTLAVAGTGAAAAGGGTAAVAGGAIATGFVTTGHVAALLAAAVITAGGAVELQPALTPAHHRAHHRAAAAGHAQPTASTATNTYSAAVATANVNSAVVEAPTAQHPVTTAAATTDRLTTRKKLPPSGGSIASGKALHPSGGTAGGTETAGGATSAADGGTSTTGSAINPGGPDSGSGTGSGATGPGSTTGPGTSAGTAAGGTAGTTGSTSSGTSGTGASTGPGTSTGTSTGTSGESGTGTGAGSTTGTSGTGTTGAGTGTSTGTSAGSATSGSGSAGSPAGGGINSHI